MVRTFAQLEKAYLPKIERDKRDSDTIKLKDCYKYDPDKSRDYYEKNKQKILARQKEYKKRPEVRSRNLKYFKEYNS
jgi:hypothetical protein